MNITKQNIYDSLNGKREFTPMHYSKVEEIIKNTNDLDDSIIRLHGLDRKVVNELWYLTENVYNADIEAHTKNDIIISGDIREVGHELNHNTFMAESPDTDETLLQFLKTIENNEHGGYKTIKEDCNIETRRDFGLIQKIHSKLVYLSNKYYKH